MQYALGFHSLTWRDWIHVAANSVADSKPSGIFACSIMQRKKGNFLMTAWKRSFYCLFRSSSKIFDWLTSSYFFCAVCV